MPYLDELESLEELADSIREILGMSGTAKISLANHLLKMYPVSEALRIELYARALQRYANLETQLVKLENHINLLKRERNG